MKRVSANDVRCTGADAGKWFKKGTCYNGFAQSIKFGFAGQTLTSDVIWTVAFNTSGYGETPLGYGTACSQSIQGCPYDSLNVGLYVRECSVHRHRCPAGWGLPRLGDRRPVLR